MEALIYLSVFMKCGSGQHKLTVCATKERYIIRNGITDEQKERCKIVC